MRPRPNVLLVTLDQFRSDSLSCAGHPVVRTPCLDGLAAEGVRFASHYSQAAPCAPGRAALYTGLYQSNNRVVANGTPLDRRFDNIALLARRCGYSPALFGYTDQAVDPRTVAPDDPRLETYEGVLPGFDAVLDLSRDHEPWLTWLRSFAYPEDDLRDVGSALRSEHRRPAEHSLSSFLTDGFLRWAHEQDEPWFAHLSYLRPHPPYRAAGHFAAMYDPESVPDPIEPASGTHWLSDAMRTMDEMRAPAEPERVRRLRSQYFGMVSEVDAALQRVIEFLGGQGVLEDTIVIVTSDHGEHLGDHGLLGKGGFFEESYRILGIVRTGDRCLTSPARGRVVESFTENIDIFPTLAELLGDAPSTQSDGASLVPFLRGESPDAWRDAAHYEYDWRSVGLASGLWRSLPEGWLGRQHLAVLRDRNYAYVQFGDASWLCFDLDNDPTWRTLVTEPEIVLPLAQRMLVWRLSIAERTHTSTLLGA